MDETITVAQELLETILAKAGKKRASALREINLEAGDLFQCKPDAVASQP